MADLFPRWLWPKVRIPYYVFSSVCLLLVVVVWTAKLARVLVYR